MYIEKQDYQLRIRLDLLDILLENISTALGGNELTPTAILQAANKIATDTIATKAGVLYNVVDELAKTADARNGYLIALGISIGLYEIYQRADDEQIPEKVIKNYNDALNVLDAIAKGKEVLDLPPKVSDGESNNGGQPGDGESAVTSGTGLRRIGSAPKRSHRI